MTEDQLNKVVCALEDGVDWEERLISRSLMPPYQIGVFCDEINNWLFRSASGDWVGEPKGLRFHNNLEELVNAVIDQFGYKDCEEDHR
jgi:hypothetical protein